MLDKMLLYDLPLVPTRRTLHWMIVVLPVYMLIILQFLEPLNVVLKVIVILLYLVLYG